MPALPNILITGGAGFIGSHIVEYFQGKANTIRVLDNLRTGYRHNLEGLDCDFIEGSITDRELVKEAVRGIDYIFHMAALVSVPESMQKIADCVEINVYGLLNVLEEAAAADVKKLVFASSAANYGDNPAVPKLETMRPEPKSPYAITKLDGEYYLEMFRSERGLPTASIRLFNVFGPRQDPRGAYAAAVPVFIEQAVQGENITIFGDGNQTRDFIYVKDIVSTLVFAATNEDMLGTYNAGYGEQMTINDLANHIIDVAQSDSRIVHTDERIGDVRHSRASIEKLSSAGWESQFSLEEGLTATFEFFNNKLHKS